MDSDQDRAATLLAYFSTGPCQQRAGMKTPRGGITTCTECPGLMRPGECKRDEAAAAIRRTADAH